jgi:hypothetical protein
MAWQPHLNTFGMCSPAFADHVNVTKLKGCEVPILARTDPYWSHSPYCPNWDYVKDFTQNLGVQRNVLITFAGAVFMPIGAGIADKVGRKPILFFCFLMGMKGLLANLVSSTRTHAVEILGDHTPHPPPPPFVAG